MGEIVVAVHLLLSAVAWATPIAFEADLKPSKSQIKKLVTKNNLPSESKYQLDSNFQAEIQRIKDWLKLGQNLHAREHFDQIKVEAQTNKFISTDLDILEAHLLAAENRHSEAIKILLRLVTENPKNKDFLLEYINLLTKGGMNELALEVAQAHTDIVSSDDLLRLKMNLIRQWIRWSRKTSWLFPKGHPLLSKARQKLETERLSETDLIFTQMLSSDYDDSLNGLHKFEDYCAKTQCPQWLIQGALSTYLNVRELDYAPKSSLDFQENSGIEDLFILAQAQSELGNIELAENYLTRIIEFVGPERIVVSGLSSANDPRVDFELKKGWVRLENGDTKNAQRIFSIHVARAPLLAAARQGLAQTYLRKGWIRLGLSEFRQWGTLDPDIYLPHLGSAEALMHLNDFAGAKEELEKAETVAGNRPEVFFLKQQLANELGAAFSIDSHLESFGPDDQEIFYSANLLSPLFHQSAFRMSYENSSRFYSESERNSLNLHWLQNGGRQIQLGLSAGAQSRLTSLSPNLNLLLPFSDSLIFQGSYEGLYLELPSEFLKSGGKAEAATLQIRYRKDEQFEGEFTNKRIYWSDSNVEQTWMGTLSDLISLTARERLNLTIDIQQTFRTFESEQYFTPLSERTARLKVNWEFSNYQSYSKQFTQILSANIGEYWQDKFDGQPVAGLGYGHQWTFYDKWGVGYSLGAEKNSYDGESKIVPVGAANAHFHF